MTKPTLQPLLTPVSMGDLALPNRIVMAPLTRMRAAHPGHVPTELMARYYAQRVSAGIIIGECAAISPQGYGWADTPGLWSDEQVRGWRIVTDAVHRKGGRIVAPSEYVISRLNDYDLSHLLLMGATTDFSGTPLASLAGDGMFRHFREIYRGTLIANTDMDQDRGNRLIAEGFADMIAFGRPYIANPDLVERFAAGAPLADVRWETVYASGSEGYIDYSQMESLVTR